MKLQLALHPHTRIRIRRFKGIRRGYFSFLILLGLILISLFAELFINSRALVVSYRGKLHFPTYRGVYLGTDFGLDYHYEVNYRELKEHLAETGEGWVIMPPIRYNPYEQDFESGEGYPPFPPSLKSGHLLGTDRIGRDIVARLVYGFRIAITFSMLYVFITYLIGTGIGCLMGLWGGLFDTISQRIIEIWERIPFLYVVMILASIYQPDFLLFLLIFIIFGWTGRTWTVRTMAYRERERDYILAARSMGASTARIVGIHILPNILVVIVTTLPFSISAGISALTALDYLGFGLRPPTPSWGELISQGISTYHNAPWILTSVVVAMVVVLTMIAFIGEGMREAFDPKRYTVYQ